MSIALPGFLINIAAPVIRTDKFLWKELPGDIPQMFGRSLDMKARIQELGRRKYLLTIISRDERSYDLGPFRSWDAAKKQAEREYSRWLKSTSMIQCQKSTNHQKAS